MSTSCCILDTLTCHHLMQTSCLCPTLSFKNSVVILDCLVTLDLHNTKDKKKNLEILPFLTDGDFMDQKKFFFGIYFTFINLYIFILRISFKQVDQLFLKI